MVKSIIDNDRRSRGATHALLDVSGNRSTTQRHFEWTRGVPCEFWGPEKGPVPATPQWPYKRADRSDAPAGDNLYMCLETEVVDFRSHERITRRLVEKSGIGTRGQCRRAIQIAQSQSLGAWTKRSRRRAKPRWGEGEDIAY